VESILSNLAPIWLCLESIVSHITELVIDLLSKGEELVITLDIELCFIADLHQDTTVLYSDDNINSTLSSIVAIKSSSP